MSEKRYDIAFSGKCAEGAEPESVRQELAALLKIDAEKLAPLFTGKRGAIRKGLEAKQARAWKAALEKVGAVPEISVSAGTDAAAKTGKAAPDQPSSPAAAPVPPASDSAAPGPVDEAPAVAAARAAPPQAPDLTVAEPGVTLVEPATVAPPAIDTSGLDLAEVGVDLVEYQKVPPPEYDLSELSLDPPGTVLTDTERPPPAKIDTSGLSLADNE